MRDDLLSRLLSARFLLDNDLLGIKCGDDRLELPWVIQLARNVIQEVVLAESCHEPWVLQEVYDDLTIGVVNEHLR